jgi:hypothetical protein
MLYHPGGGVASLICPSLRPPRVHPPHVPAARLSLCLSCAHLVPVVHPLLRPSLRPSCACRRICRPIRHQRPQDLGAWAYSSHLSGVEICRCSWCVSAKWWRTEKWCAYLIYARWRVCCRLRGWMEGVPWVGTASHARMQTGTGWSPRQICSVRVGRETSGHRTKKVWRALTHWRPHRGRDMSGHGENVTKRRARAGKGQVRAYKKWQRGVLTLWRLYVCAMGVLSGTSGKWALVSAHVGTAE